LLREGGRSTDEYDAGIVIAQDTSSAIAGLHLADVTMYPPHIRKTKVGWLQGAEASL